MTWLSKLNHILSAKIPRSKVTRTRQISYIPVNFLQHKKKAQKEPSCIQKNAACKTQMHRCLCWTDFHRKRQHTRSSRFPDLRLPIPGCFFHNARSDILRLLMLSHNDIMQDFLPLTVTGSSGTRTRFSFTRLLKVGT